MEAVQKKIPLPEYGKRNILITSALPYVNNVPHLGNIIGCVLSADVFARYCRLRGHNVLYICGTDEYGTATETKALEEKVTPQEICDKYYKVHSEVYKWFDISFDHFGRTTTTEQKRISQDIFLKLHKNGYLIEGAMDQFFCEKCSRFLADRYVEGNCPSCGYEDARGDQCDKCQRLLNPTELVNPRCKICRSAPVLRRSEHLFLDLPSLQPRLEEWINKASKEGRWSQNAIQATRGWLKNLERRCITRDLKWGVPVPLEKYKEKVFYVWFDAPIGYISITANVTPEWERWWKNPSEVQLYQFMGKDNVPFHTIIFPSSLIGTNEPYTLLHHVSTTEYLNYEGGKFSKSRGIGVFGTDAVNTGIPADVWRFYLLSNRPEVSDTTFLWSDFQAKNNSELLAKFGNFVNRALKFLEANYGSVVPAAGPLTQRDTELIADVNKEVKSYIEHLDAVSLKEGIHIMVRISALGNQYLQEEQPWVLIKSDKARCDTVLNVTVNLVRLIAVLCEPYMPATARRIVAQLNLPDLGPLPDRFELTLQAGHRIGTPEVLVRKIEDKEIEALKARFGSAPKETFPLDIRVGQILSAQNHPSAERLYILEIDLGKEKRTVVAGLREHYTAEQLVGQRVPVLVNLKAATLQGVKSHGMVLVAAPANRPFLLLSCADQPVGTPVVPAGVLVQPKPNLDFKKDFQKIELKTIEGGRAALIKGTQAIPLVFQGQSSGPQNKEAGAGATIR